MRECPIGQGFETDGGHSINGLERGGTRRMCKSVKDNDLHLSPFPVNLSEIKQVETKSEGAAAFMVGTTEYAVPLGNLINVEEELKKLEADLKYQEGFLQSVMKKLSNEKFVSKAPANVIEMERKKQADAETKIAALKESIAALKR